MAGTRINRKLEINGILYLAAAAILAAAFYLPAGKIGWLGDILIQGGQGLLGSAALALPVIFLYMAIDYLLEQQLKITRLRFTYVLILLLGTAALLHLLTVDQASLLKISQGQDASPTAAKMLLTLWKIGGEPGLVGAGRVLPGGILGGSIAQALLAIAGKTGSIIIIAALMLSMLVMLLNVSLSRAVGRTAQVIQQAGQHVDQAVRTSMATIRENRAAETQEGRNFDLLLPENGIQTAKAAESKTDNKTEAPATSKPEPETHKYSLLESLKRLWQSDDEPEITQPETDNSVPEFLKTGGTEFKATPQIAETEKAGISQKSPYDLKIKNQEWILSPAEQSATQAPVLNYPINAATEAGLKNSPDPVLPAGIHRICPSGIEAEPEAAPHDFADTGLNPADSREDWADRTSGVDAGNAMDILKPKKITATGQPGSQLAINLPYTAPPLGLLKEDPPNMQRSGSSAPPIQALGRKLERTLESFGIQATVVHVTTGPTITRFELSPGPGVKVSRIVSLSDDIALNLAAMGVRIEAPIPGKSAIGIEIPNKETSPVLLRGILESPEFQRVNSPLTAALGRDIQGSPILCDLAKMPHLLIAGATGSGKSVCINSILMSILFRSSPEEVRMLMIDPKVVELSVYNGIPHLMAPVVTDPKKAANTLLWAVNEMTRRYGLFAEKAVRDINSYNAAALRGDEDFEKLPLILLVIDELSDLMATTPTEVEDAIARLTAMARAAGIHLIIATQRPSVDVITGVIKANIPSRIAFAVASQVDSRTILDMAGAEKLLGKGDMLYYPQSSAKPVRGQGAFVTDAEVERVLTHIKTQHTSDYNQEISDAIMAAPVNAGKERDSSEQDELLPQALDIVVEAGYASVSLLQRRMNVGYPRAARLIDRLQEKGFVGPFEGSKPRKVLISPTQLMEVKAREEI